MFSFKVAENQKHRLVGCYNIPLSFTTLPSCLFSCLLLVFLKAIFKYLLFCFATWKCGFQRRQHWEEIQLWQGGLDARLCCLGLQIYGNFTPTMSIWKPQLGSPTQGFLLVFFFPSSVNLSNINQYQLGQLQSLKLDRTVLLLWEG